MPFTTSHPALILPLKKLGPRWFSLTGLMAGAMAPDLLYFVMGITTFRGFGHSWWGMFAIDLPAAILFSFVFHRWFKYHVIINLPAPFDRRLSGLAESEFKVIGIRSWLAFVVSILVGILSHFFWDSFTHNAGEMVRLIPWLGGTSTLFGVTMHRFEFAQFLSSVLGGLVMLLFFLKSELIPHPTLQQSIRSHKDKLLFWIGGGVAAALFATAMVWFYDMIFDWRIGLHHDIRPVFFTGGLASWAGFVYAVCGYTLLKKHLAHRRAVAAVPVPSDETQDRLSS